jgi:nucleotide-binding universal stress UspA family protein
MTDASTPVALDIRHILSPTDLSEASAHAAELAVDLARVFGARLTGLFVLSPLALALPGVGAAGGERAAPESELERLQRETARRFAAAGPAGVNLDVLVQVGPPMSGILDCASRLPADLIVLGTHGAGGFERLLIGSVAQKVLRKATCPVITVPPKGHVTSRVPFRRLLCAVDASDTAASALGYASALVQKTGAGLTVLHVIEWPWEEPPAPALAGLPPAQAVALAEYRRYRESSAARWLESLVEASTGEPSAVGRRIAHGKPYAQILAAAAEQDSDLIVIGVSSRSTLDLALFGSTAVHVVREASCPVLTVRR